MRRGHDTGHVLCVSAHSIPSCTQVIVDSSAARKQPIFRPKLLDVLTKSYTAEDLKQDVLAGAAGWNGNGRGAHGDCLVFRAFL